MPAAAAEGLEEREREEQEGSGSEGAAPALPQSSFTQRSRAVLAEFKRHLVPGTAIKRRHPSQGGLPATQLSLDDVVRGKSRTDACRWVLRGGGCHGHGRQACVVGPRQACVPWAGIGVGQAKRQCSAEQQQGICDCGGDVQLG